MGRPAHEIWELFTIVVARSREENKAHPDVKCAHRSTLLTNAQPSRNVLRHAPQCGELSDEAKVKWKDLEKKQRQSMKEKFRMLQKRTPDKGSASSLNKRLFGTPFSAVATRKSPRTQKKPTKEENYLTHDAPNTSVYIARSIVNAIDEIESVVGKGAVTSVVTGNTANMKGAWKIIQHEREGIICNGCAAHDINLLMKDVFELEDFAAILQQAKMVSRFLKDHHAMWDRFKQLQKQMKREREPRRRLSLPVPTRWYSSEKCIKSVVANKDVIAAVFSDNELLHRYQRSSNKVTQVKELLRNESF